MNKFEQVHVVGEGVIMWWEGDVAHLLTDRLSSFICFSLMKENVIWMFHSKTAQMELLTFGA